MRHKVALLRGFALIAAESLAFNMFFIFMPNNLIARHGVGLRPTLLVTAAALAAAAAAALLAQVLIGMALAGVLSVAMLGEAFPTPVRSTSVALTAGIATALIVEPHRGPPSFSSA